MLDALIVFWAVVLDWLTDPRVAAAFAAMLVSILRGYWQQTILVGVLAYCFIPLFIWFGVPETGAAGIGALMAFVGVHGIEDRLDQLDIKYLIGVIVDKLRGKR